MEFQIMESAAPAGTRSIHRVLDLITELGQHVSGASVSTLANGLGLPAPTVHRLLQVLVTTGFATKDPASKHYSLGPRLVSLAHQVDGGATLAAVARGELERLAEVTTETVFLSVLDGTEVRFLDCIASSHAVQMWSPPGSRRPLHATSQGKVILSFLSSESVDWLLSKCDLRPHTAATITDRARLLDELMRIRESGFALNDGEFEEDTRSVAAPILDSRRQAVGAVCVGVPSFRASVHKLRQDLAPLVVEAAERVSRKAQTELRHLPPSGVEALAKGFRAAASPATP
jgi:DNA-binding IclR family transcriptional regulator